MSRASIVRLLALLLIYVTASLTYYMHLDWGHDSAAPVIPVLAVMVFSAVVIFYDEQD